MKREYTFWFVGKIKLFVLKHCFYKVVGAGAFIPFAIVGVLFYRIHYGFIKREFIQSYQKGTQCGISFSVYIGIYSVLFRIKRHHKFIQEFKHP